LSATTSADLDSTRARAAALGLLAAMLGPDPDAWRAGELDALRTALGRLGADRARRALDQLGSVPNAEDVRDHHGFLFAHARVSPYECGHVPTGVSGPTGRLADVAGFYRAYGFEVHGERPDHCAVELEFAAVLALAELEAERRGDAQGREICADTWRTYLRDHLGGWLDRLADRIDEIDPRAPQAVAARTAAALVASEVERLGIELAPITGGLPILDDDDFELRCGDCPAAEGLGTEAHPSSW